MSGYVPRNLRKRGARRDKPRAAEAAEESAKPTKSVAKARSRPRPSPGPKNETRTATSTARTKRGRSRLRRRWSRLRGWLSNLGSRRLAMILGPATLVLALVAGGAWYFSHNAAGPDRSGAAADAAGTAASALFSYDYRDFDSSMNNGVAHATGRFAEEYREISEDLRETVESESAQMSAEVVNVAVVDADASYEDDAGNVYGDAVEVLAFVDQIVQNDNIEGSRVDELRVVLTMVEADGGWKAVQARAI